MNVERVRDFLLTLPHVVETEQLGGLIFWVGDKAVGGKMFAMLPLDEGTTVISYPAGAERSYDLLELDGMVPAPYMARIFWVAALRWDVFRNAEWESELRAAHGITFAKLPPKALKVFALPPVARRKAIAEARKKLAAAKAQSKP